MSTKQVAGSVVVVSNATTRLANRAMVAMRVHLCEELAALDRGSRISIHREVQRSAKRNRTDFIANMRGRGRIRLEESTGTSAEKGFAANAESE